MSTEHDYRNDVRAYALGLLRNGFNSTASIEKRLGEYAADSMGDFGVALEDDAMYGVVREELAAARTAHHADMAKWPKVTDCDRLDAAFTELNAMGIMARHNWTCCGTCGGAEMPDEFHRLEGTIQGKPIIGYIFYHQQDTDGAVEDGSIHFNYGTTLGGETDEEYERKSVEIARTACDVFAKHGLKTIWNGSFDKRPGITLDWKRRGAPKDYVDLDALHMGDAGKTGDAGNTGDAVNSAEAGSEAKPITSPDGEVAMLGAQPQSVVSRIVSIFTKKR